MEVALKERSIDRYYCRYYRRYLKFLTLSYIKDSRRSILCSIGTMLGTFTIDDNIDDRIDRLNAPLSIYRSEYSFARHEITNKTSVASFSFFRCELDKCAYL